MIDQVDKDLQAWLKSIVAEVDVVFGAPRSLDGKHAVSLYLLALVEPPQVWLNRLSTTRVALRYLVTTWADDEVEAHRLLGMLIQAVLGKQEYEFNLAELPATIWTAFGIAPRPSFTFDVPLRFERTEPAPKLVRAPLVVRGAPVVRLDGVVLGPDDIPIMGANVEVPTLQLTTYTDTRGRFHFSTIPAEPPAVGLLVKARGQSQQLTLDHTPASGEIVTIRFDSFDAK